MSLVSIIKWRCLLEGQFVPTHIWYVHSVEFNKCFVCKCNIWKEIIVMIDSIAVNLAKNDTEVSLCEIYVVEKVSKGEKVMILHPVAPVSLAGRK